MQPLRSNIKDEASAESAVAIVSAEQWKRAVATITLSFAADPMARWSMPDSETFLTFFPALARAFAGNALENGTVYQISDFAGASVWLEPGFEPDHDAMGQIIEKAMPAARQKEAESIFEQMAQFHPAEPHWFLPLIGVDPAHQGNGYGSALLQHVLDRSDVDGAPAYLESSNPANIPFYKRFGFEQIGEIQSGASPTLYPMLRKHT